MNIQALIYDGFDELDVIGVYEPLRMAGFNVALLSLHKQEIIKTAHGLRIHSDGILNLENKPDILIVPGGGWVNRSPQGAWIEAKKEDLLQTLVSFHKAGVVMTSVCTGAMLLAKAGLLAGRPATTNDEAIEELRLSGAKVITARVVDDDDIVTAGGITSSLDLGLWLIKRFAGQDKANEISKRLEFEARSPVWTRNSN